MKRLARSRSVSSTDLGDLFREVVSEDTHQEQMDDDMDINSEFSADSNANLAAMKNHPLGRLLLNIVQDNFELHKKLNIKNMSCDVEDICHDFLSALKLEDRKITSELNRTVREVEDNILSRELNSHSINQSVSPPTKFSKSETLISPQRMAEALHLFPKGGSKFSGKEHTVSIAEFLSICTSAQEQLHLTEKEFKERLLQSCTGQPYLLVLQYIENDESVGTIYHNLYLNYDKRVTAQQARETLSNYKAFKTQNLAKTEANIMLYAGRASTALPKGPSRSNFYDLLAVQALIDSLPHQSSLMVNNLFNSLTAKLNRSATYSELSKSLNRFRDTIDQDIRQNGVDSQRKSKPINEYRAIPSRQKKTYKTFAINVGENKKPYGDRQHNGNRQRPKTINKGGIKKSYATGSNSIQLGSGKKFCSLCGRNNHSAVDGCRMMQDDKGKVISVSPTYTPCTLCPDFVQRKKPLNHPSKFCPWRTNGPMDKKSSR